MIETASRWIREKINVIRNAGAPPSPVNNPLDEAGQARQKFADAIGSFTDFFKSTVNKLEENTYLREFLVIGESFRKSGYVAGLWGIREHGLEGTAAMRVLITKNLIEEKFQSNQRNLESHVKLLETLRTNAERDYQAKNRYYQKLNRAYQYSHRQFSLVLGCIYGFFALALILADIPLALELTKRGLNLKSDKFSAISDLFAFGTPEGFIPHFLRVLTVNWEVVIFATGIAFCTIYIKIFYDDFVGVPLENLIKKASESPEDYGEAELGDVEVATRENGDASLVQEITTVDQSGINENESRKEARAARFSRLWWVRFCVKLAVLLVLFATILVLGYFRYSVTSQTQSEVAGVPRLVIFLTYTLLTLIFPIISGICGSLSLSSFHNWSEMNKARKENARAEQKLLEATDRFRIKWEEKERNKSFLEWMKKEETLKHLKNFLIDCYNAGYKFGYLYPQWIFGGDLYTRAEALRNRNLADPDQPLTSEVPAVSSVKILEGAVN
ncbi:MAG: hypothetical protein QOF62_2282 [Pyrinomonadaceae bacterium]|jgi:hypothetical protein|nr:hypothetical protein [Pyrinomonadaceae bacterium]